MAFLRVHTPKESYEIPLGEKVFTIGRAKEASLRLSEQECSKLQCHIVYQDSAYFILDLASRNGTYLNQIRLQSKVRLNDQDKIRIGACILEFCDPEFSEFSESSESLLRAREETALSEGATILSSPKTPEKKRLSRRSSKNPSSSVFIRFFFPFLALSFLLLMIFWPTPSQTLSVSYSTLLANASFEERLPSNQELPASWLFKGTLSGEVQLKAKDSSSPCVELLLQNANLGKPDDFFQAESVAVSIQPGKFYRVEADLHLLQGVAGISLFYFNPLTQEHWEQFQFFSENLQEKRLQLESLAPFTSSYAQVRLLTVGPQSKALFDHISLELAPSSSKNRPPYFYELGPFVFQITNQGFWTLFFQERPLLSEASWEFASPQCRFYQNQLYVESIQERERKLVLLGKLYDFEAKCWKNFQYFVQLKESQILFEYDLPPEWVVAPPYWSAFKIYQASEALELENVPLSEDFESSSALTEFLWKVEEKEEIRLSVEPALFLKSESLPHGTILRFYPTQAKIRLTFEWKIHQREREETSSVPLEELWITATAQYRRKSFGKAYQALQEILQKTSPESPLFSQAQEKRRELLSEGKILLARLKQQEIPSENSLSQALFFEREEYFKQYQNTPLEKDFQEYLAPFLKENLKKKETTNADTLFQMAVEAIEKKEYLKGKLYLDSALSRSSPPQTSKIQEKLIEIDPFIQKLLQDSQGERQR